MRRAIGVLVACALAVGAPAAVAATASAPRPGPPLLYRKPAVAPQLSNRKPWRARPILISGTTAYRSGEFLYQDFLYDDHGARAVADPTDPRAPGDLFSKPNGTYTYPTGPGYANDAADLVEFRVRALKRFTAFRITLNTLRNPALVAFSIAIGGNRRHLHKFPRGANVVAPAKLFLTVHVRGRRMVAELVRAASGKRVRGPAPRVRVDRRRRQIQVEVPHRDWNPRRHTVRFALGVGLWDRAQNRYLLPRAIADATHPGGAGTASHPAAFFNVAFRTHEPFPSVAASPSAITNAAWWRDQRQGTALAHNTIRQFFANVSFRRLARRAHDDSRVPRFGPMDRILASHFEPAQGANFSHECGFGGESKPSSCVPEYQGRLQPYAIYVPKARRPASGYGLTLLLHSLSAPYNQYLGSRNQAQFANRPNPSIVITPEARGPDQFYEGYGGADVFEVWADVAHRYKLNPTYADITGYSMGGYGTFTLGSQFPDLFARAQPTVGTATNADTLASLRNVPVLMWNNSADELVSPISYLPTASKLANLGYRYELDVYQPCHTSTMPQKCSPLFPNHLELAINDQYAPAASFLGAVTVNPNPAHVTYVLDGERDRPSLGIVANHAYWVYGLSLRTRSHKGQNGDPEGQIDAVSHGFGHRDPAASPLHVSAGTLEHGNLGPLHFTSFSKTWGAAPPAPRGDSIDITATNIASASIDPGRARVDCKVALHITSDGPITVSLPRCHRVVRAG